MQYYVLVEKYKSYFEKIIKNCYSKAENTNTGKT